jgi:hypothetical protein
MLYPPSVFSIWTTRTANYSLGTKIWRRKLKNGYILCKVIYGTTHPTRPYQDKGSRHWNKAQSNTSRTSDNLECYKHTGLSCY